jgi:hypothetical protein
VAAGNLKGKAMRQLPEGGAPLADPAQEPPVVVDEERKTEEEMDDGQSGPFVGAQAVAATQAGGHSAQVALCGLLAISHCSIVSSGASSLLPRRE